MKNFFMMECFKDAGYSVDVLAENGKAVTSICRKKIYPIGSPTQTADIVRDRRITDYAESIVSNLGFDFFVQLEIGFNSSGQPRLVEINPRIDATLPIVEAEGLNYFEEMVHYALTGCFDIKRYPRPKRPVRFYRYWQHIFSKV